MSMHGGLVIPAPMRALSPAGVFLPLERIMVPLSRLAGARLVAPHGLVRLEEVHPFLAETPGMRWRYMDLASTASLRDGGMAVLLFAGLDGPCAEVLALPVVPKDAGTEDGTDGARSGAPFTYLLGRMLARHAVDGHLRIAEGDLAWMNPRLDPADRAYFRNGSANPA